MYSLNTSPSIECIFENLWILVYVMSKQHLVSENNLDILVKEKERALGKLYT